MAIYPKTIDLKRDTALTVGWSDGRVSVYPIALLRRLSPSADAKEIRKELSGNPLAVLSASNTAPLTALDVAMVGHYAVRVRFSDGHETGLYTWAYLREIDPAQELAD